MRRWLSAAVVLGTSMLLATIAGTPAAAAVPERDPERYSSTATGWGYMFTNKASIDTWLNNNHQRAIDVEVNGADSYSVVGVDNNNPAFTRTPGGSFSWTTGETSASLASKISTSGRRLIDIERYTLNGSTYFAAAWVDNTGEAAKSWWWYLNITPGDISTRLSSCGCRLVDIDPLGNGRYDVIMIPNSGVDALGWWWYYGITQTQVFQFLSDHGARAVDVEPDGSGRFAVLMVRDGLTGSVRFDQSWSTLTSGPSAGQRYIHVKRYTNSSGLSVHLSVSMQNG